MTPTRFTHRLDGTLQWEYDAWLAEQCGDVEPLQPWRQEMYELTGLNLVSHVSHIHVKYGA